MTNPAKQPDHPLGIFQGIFERGGWDAVTPRGAIAAAAAAIHGLMELGVDSQGNPIDPRIVAAAITGVANMAAQFASGGEQEVRHDGRVTLDVHGVHGGTPVRKHEGVVRIVFDEAPPTQPDAPARRG